MKTDSDQERCVCYRGSADYTEIRHPLVAAEKITRRGFLQKSGTAGVAVGMVGLAKFAQAQSGSASGSGAETYFIVCIGDPGPNNRVIDPNTQQQGQNTLTPGNYQWQRVEGADFDDPGLGPEDSLAVTVSASGPRKGAKAASFKITGVATASYIEDDLFTGIVNSDTTAQTDQSVQLGTTSSPKVRPKLIFVNNPVSDHNTSEERNTLQVRVDITSGTVIGTATDSGGPIVDWQVDAGTGGANLTLKAPETQTQNPETRTGCFIWTFAVQTEAEYLKWCAANQVTPP